jgi:hypothetical protein
MGKENTDPKQAHNNYSPYLPTGMEVLHVAAVVPGRFALAPEQETLLGGHLCHAAANHN